MLHESFGEYLKEKQKRTGSKNKIKPTYNFKLAYNDSVFAKAKSIPFSEYSNAIRLKCDELKERLVSGDRCFVPEFGKLDAFSNKSGLVKKKTKEGEVYIDDRRSIDFVKALRNKFNVENGLECTDSYRYSTLIICIKLIRKSYKKNRKAHSLYFVATKNLIRDIKNNLYDGNYKTFEAKEHKTNLSKNLVKNIWEEFLKLAFAEFEKSVENDNDFCFILPLLGKIYYRKHKTKQNEDKEIQTNVHNGDYNDGQV